MSLPPRTFAEPDEARLDHSHTSSVVSPPAETALTRERRGCSSGGPVTGRIAQGTRRASLVPPLGIADNGRDESEPLTRQRIVGWWGCCVGGRTSSGLGVRPPDFVADGVCARGRKKMEGPARPAFGLARDLTDAAGRPPHPGAMGSGLHPGPSGTRPRARRRRGIPSNPVARRGRAWSRGGA